MRIPASGSMRTLDRLSRLLDQATIRNGGRPPRWVNLVLAVRSRPHTTGELGHIYGIGENVRGIRREADRNLIAIGFTIEAEETDATDRAGQPIYNATYRLVDLRLQPHLDRTDRVIEQLKLGV